MKNLIIALVASMLLFSCTMHTKQATKPTLDQLMVTAWNIKADSIGLPHRSSLIILKDSVVFRADTGMYKQVHFLTVKITWADKSITDGTIGIMSKSDSPDMWIWYGGNVCLECNCPGTIYACPLQWTGVTFRCPANGWCYCKIVSSYIT